MRVKQKIYFIQEHLHEEFYHGGIGPADIERILLQEGAQALFFPYNNSFTLKAKLYRLIYGIRLLFTLEKEAIVFFQYPLYARLHYILLRSLRLFRKKVRVVCLIDEINGLKYGDHGLLAWEKKWFTRFPFVIVHNHAMQTWFRENVPGRQTTILQLFDFLTTPVTRQRALAPVIAYAGNLAESGFQERLGKLTNGGELVFHLYGLPAPDTTTLPANVVYKGVFRPYDLPAHIDAAFGLVWDGKEADRIAGSFGHYMQYISHHKVSLHIMSRIPSIVYEQAGTAAFIREHQIGFTINSLEEIPARLQQLTEAEYQQMCVNTEVLAQRLAAGEHLKRALRELLEITEAVKVDKRKA